MPRKKKEEEEEKTTAKKKTVKKKTTAKKKTVTKKTASKKPTTKKEEAPEAPEVLGDIISAITGVKPLMGKEIEVPRDKEVVAKKEREETPLDSMDDIEKYLLASAKELIDGSLQSVQEVRDYVEVAPEWRDVDALSKLIASSANAMEILNKLILRDKQSKAAKEIKEMDIKSRKEIADQDNETKLLMNREELIEKMMKKAEIVDVEAEEVKNKD